ncbi:prepilin-type N-terminal cleavage/methylation domain-containing protein [Pyxidicoccus fallax]|uniref:Prepilin-type N-terminal cleavage/methylation domain-containing protein n=1 Tax=Pyxidicoccus fallax TaxID=394095 RepID=A0A848LRH2_9BACT|nr:prepilin-type N-terminal cleavage/methylation domain-containing protein [Pyxidicoccus fallax]NMO20054.1 prepilin-type N-terminal cleavage/methylation domain-containing protein [Pyxidicoccus fallax]NPC81689.1 prepilin-type N-terminal cleavage/methylation domain-containing protein [Pyxidicoccus fallax]
MRQTASFRRGFTLLEMTISAAIGAVVLAITLTGIVQLQRRAAFEEQTMMAQVTGRAVKDLLATDLQRAGLGMGNTPITFADGDLRFAIQAWTEPDLSVNMLPYFAADPAFALPPAGTTYEHLRSDVLQLYWGDTRSMIVMDACGQKSVIREGNSFTFCTAANPPTLLDPPTGQRTPAIIVNPRGNVACHLEISRVMASSSKFNANPGSAIGNTGTPPCGDPDSPVWADTGWVTLRTQGASYRVNWAGGTPALEFQAPGTPTWTVVSRDVERMKVRQAVIDLAAPLAEYRWFPDPAEGRPAIDRCTRATCSADTGSTPSSDTELRRMLQQRVREVEVTLVVRTRRADVTVPRPGVAVAYDEEGFPVDGFKRRTFTFRVTPRNFSAGGLQGTQPGGTGT